MVKNLKKLFAFTIVINLCLFVTGCTAENQNGSLNISSDVEFGKEDYQQIVSSNNQLGFQLLATAPRNDDNNLFISPMSLFMALSMVYNGADGTTKEEMAKVLHAQGIDANELNKANASLMTKLFQNLTDIELNVANSIWLNQNFHFQDEFAQNNQDYFNAEIKEIDIRDNKSVSMINDWVKQSTNGKIDNIVDNPLNPNLVAILINAIYFKGNWTNEFDKKLTEKRPFTLVDGEERNIPLMKLNEKLPYLENDKFQAVSLPYGDEQMSMNIFLPKENVHLEQFEQLLNIDNWQKWKASFNKKEGTILLPKFQLEYEVELKDTLKKLGMNAAFDRNNANFSKMIQENTPLCISKVKQKTFIDVTEKGTEAAATTSVEMETASAPIVDPFNMEVNRPFFIAITDDETGAILFMGSIANPQQ